MKLILPKQCDSLIVVESRRDDGELIVELTDSPGNFGKENEVLESLWHRYEGRFFSFTEERKC